MADIYLKYGWMVVLPAIGYLAIRAAHVVPPSRPVLPNPRKAGWWSLAALLAMYLLIGGLMALVAASGSTGVPEEANQPVDRVYTPGAVSNVLVSYLLLIAPAAMVMRVRREPLATAGVRRENLLASLLIGLLLGAVIIGLAILAEYQTLVPLSGGHFWALLYFAVVGFSEEFSFRGYLQTRLTAWLGKWPGWLLASLAMAMIHVGQRVAVGGFDLQQALQSSLELMPYSLILGALTLWSGNVVLPGVMHTIMDWANTLFKIV